VGWALGLLAGVLVIVGGGRLLSLDAITLQRAVCLVCDASAGIGGVVVFRTLPPDPGAGPAPAPSRLRRALREAARFGIRGAGFPFTPARMDPRGPHPRQFVRRFTPELALYFAAIGLPFAGFGAFFAPLPAYLGGVGFGLYLALNVGAAAFIGVSGTLVERFEVTLVTQLSPPIVRGEALGVYSALSAAGGVGSVIGGWLAAGGYAQAFGFAGGLIFAGVGVVLLLRRTVRTNSAATERAGHATTERTEWRGVSPRSETLAEALGSGASAA